MVTSPEPSDGKSTTAANLAIVLAQQGKQVLLVDTDLRKPSVHYTFNVSNMIGLTSVLTKKFSLDRAILKTNVPNLEILTSGPIPPNPSELLNSNAMEIVVAQMNNIFDFIVFDTPPVLAVTDPQIIASKCDGVIMVIASGKTNKDRAMEAKILLEKVPDSINWCRSEWSGELIKENIIDIMFKWLINNNFIKYLAFINHAWLC